MFKVAIKAAMFPKIKAVTIFPKITIKAIKSVYWPETGAVSFPRIERIE